MKDIVDLNMLKLPKVPSKDRQETIFKRQREYTTLDKLLVYNLLFDTQALDGEIEQAKTEITKNLKIKDWAFDLVFT